MEEWNASFTVEEATMTKLLNKLEEIDVTATPSFKVTDKHGNTAIYKRERVYEKSRGIGEA